MNILATMHERKENETLMGCARRMRKIVFEDDDNEDDVDVLRLSGKDLMLVVRGNFSKFIGNDGRVINKQLMKAEIRNFIDWHLDHFFDNEHEPTIKNKRELFLG